jgi:uncharacterized membrane protein
MTDATPRKPPLHFNFQGNLIAGLLTITPLVVVWLVFDFFLTTLSNAGHPIASQLVDFIDDRFPGAAPWLADPTIQWLIALIVAILVLYSIGAIASRVVGRKLIEWFERLIGRIPVVQSIYSAAKKLVGVTQQKPEGASRVVLIEFPHPGLKAIGFVMRTFTDTSTGQELAAVFVPTAPNPTSGYLEIAPLPSLVATDISVDQAMAMILSGGATAPERIATGPGSARR